MEVRDTRSPGSGITGSCELTDKTVEDQCVFLTTKPFLQPLQMCKLEHSLQTKVCFFFFTLNYFIMKVQEYIQYKIVLLE